MRDARSRRSPACETRMICVALRARRRAAAEEVDGAPRCTAAVSWSASAAARRRGRPRGVTRRIVGARGVGGGEAAEQQRPPPGSRRPPRPARALQPPRRMLGERVAQARCSTARCDGDRAPALGVVIGGRRPGVSAGDSSRRRCIDDRDDDATRSSEDARRHGAAPSPAEPRSRRPARGRHRALVDAQFRPIQCVHGEISGSVAIASDRAGDDGAGDGREAQPRAADALAAAHVRRRPARGGGRSARARGATSQPNQTMKLALCSPRTTPPPGPSGGERDAGREERRPSRGCTIGPSRRRSGRRRPGAHVVAMPGVVAHEAVAGARDLQPDDRDEQHPDEDVPREERLQREQRQPLDGEQDEQHARRSTAVRRELPVRAAARRRAGAVPASRRAGALGRRPARAQSSSRR